MLKRVTFKYATFTWTVRLTHNVFIQRAITERRLCTHHGLIPAGDGEAAAPSDRSEAELQVLDWKLRQGRDPHPGCSQGRLPEGGDSCVEGFEARANPDPRGPRVTQAAESTYSLVHAPAE